MNPSGSNVALRTVSSNVKYSVPVSISMSKLTRGASMLSSTVTPSRLLFSGIAMTSLPNMSVNVPFSINI